MNNDKSTGNRLQLILNREFNGKAIKAAKILGVSPTAISQFLNNRRQPSFPVMVALAQKSRVNLNWFLTGEGIPYDEDDLEPNCSLPLADQYLTGHPNRWKYLPRLSLPKPKVLAKPSRYLIKLPKDEPALMEDSNLLAGDLCLIDNNADDWLRENNAKIGTLCTVVKGKKTLLACVLESLPNDFLRLQIYQEGEFIVYYGNERTRAVELTQEVSESVNLVGVMVFVWRNV